MARNVARPRARALRRARSARASRRGRGHHRRRRRDPRGARWRRPPARSARCGARVRPDRVSRFDELASYLADIPTTLDIPIHLPALADEASSSLPFFEAYFSNVIEGTEFCIDEAEAIVESGAIPDERPEDAHDVLGTFEAVHDLALRAATPATLEELFELLERRHRLVMGGRPDKRPGQFKEKANQAGSYVFVAPPLVEGTLVEGFKRLRDPHRVPQRVPDRAPAAVDGQLIATNAQTDSTDAEREGVRLELP
jgi:hypothetical protein